MRLSRLLVAIVLMLLIASRGEAGDVSDMPSTVREFVDAELAFARLCADSGIKAGFLANMTEDAHIFRPQPVAAHEFYEGLDAVPGRLEWTPVFVEVSSDGNFGYTTGPWWYFASDSDSVASEQGEYVTVWVRQPDGTLKWPIDIGITHPPSDRPVPKLTWRIDRGEPPTAEEVRARWSPRFAFVVSLNGAIPAGKSEEEYSRLLAEHFRVYRNGRLPMTDRDDVLGVCAAEQRKFVAKARAGRDRQSSTSNDLFCDWGETENLDSSGAPNGQRGGYVRIWSTVKTDLGPGWQLALEVINRPDLH